MLLISRFRIAGHSMEPTLKDTQRVIVSSIPFLFARPKVNDIVAVKLGSKIFLKRISKIKDETYYLTGDNKEDSLDSKKLGWVERKQILGKVL